jgi:hypothetical protein
MEGPPTCLILAGRVFLFSQRISVNHMMANAVHGSIKRQLRVRFEFGSNQKA